MSLARSAGTAAVTHGPASNCGIAKVAHKRARTQVCCPSPPCPC